MNETRTSLQNQSAQIRSLEVQISQMANMFSKRQQGNLPSTSKMNPKRDVKEHCKAITLRTGKELETPVRIEKSNKDERKVSSPTQVPSEKNVEDKVPVQAQPSQEPSLRVLFPQRLKKSKRDQ